MKAGATDLANTDAGNVPWRVRIAWGLGSMPISALSITANVLLLRFMTDSLGLAPALGSLLLGVAKLYDAAVDPLMGWLSDRIGTPWGTRLPWLLVGGLLAALFLVGTFAAPFRGAVALPAYMLLMMLLFATAYTIFMIPYMAMPAEITASYHGRTQLMSLRVVFSTVGTMGALALAPYFLGLWGATREGHTRMALVIASISVVAVLICVSNLRGVLQPAAVSSKHEFRFLPQIRAAFANRPFCWLMLAKAMHYLVLALALTSFAYFTKHVLQVPDAWLGKYLLAQSIVGIASQLLWVAVTRRIGKKRAFQIAAIAAGVGYASWWWATAAEPVWVTGIRAVLLGIAGGGSFLLTQAMLPDVIEADLHQTGISRSGTLVGVYILVEKVAGAIGIAFLGVFLQALGYVEAIDGARVPQPAGALLGIRASLSILPAACYVVALLAISKYTVDEGQLDELRKRTIAHS